MDHEYENELARAVAIGFERLANAITRDAPGSIDASGCYVQSLTEAVMGLTKAVYQAAGQVEYLLDLINELPRE